MMPTTGPTRADAYDWDRIDAGYRAVDALNTIIGELRGLRVHDPDALPQLQACLGVPLGPDAVAVDRRPAEHVVEQREDVSEGMGGAVVCEVGGLQQHRRQVGLGVDPRCRRAQPRLGHQ